MAEASQSPKSPGITPRKRGIGGIAWSFGLVVAILMVANFALAIVAWLFALYMALRDRTPVDWGQFRFAIPAPLLLAVFLIAILRRNRRRVFYALICTGILVTCSWSFYDALHDNYQIQVMTRTEGCKHTYFNWPWLTGVDTRLQDLVRPPTPVPGTQPADAVRN